MPWCETSSMDQKQAFVWECAQGWWAMSDLCARYGISRKTGYKWLTRYRAGGGIAEQSRRPHRCPHAIADDVVQQLLRFRRAHPRWGPKKLHAELTRQWPAVVWPARSTISLLLKRHGLVTARRRRRRPGHPGAPLTAMSAPNAVWSIDFKGQFRTGDGAWCYPLTLSDGYSRFLLACSALTGPTRSATQRVLEGVFRRYGLPVVLRSDNGSPFAGTGLARLSRLAVWLIRLGIRPELTQPASPQQNGRHERMHRTLKAETAMPPAATRRAQAHRFDRFRRAYNEARPHEALAQAYPASLFVPSPRPWPTTLPVLEYPAGWCVQRVYGSGEITWRGHRLWLSDVLCGERIALQEIAEGYWDMRLGPITIGVLDEHDRRVKPAALRATITGGARLLAHARAVD